MNMTKNAGSTRRNSFGGGSQSGSLSFDKREGARMARGLGKRVLNLALSVILVVGLMPSLAFAEGGGALTASPLQAASLDANGCGIVEDQSKVVDDNGSHSLGEVNGLVFSATSDGYYSLDLTSRFPQSGATNQSVKITLPFGLSWSGDGSSSESLVGMLSGSIDSEDPYSAYGTNTYRTRVYHIKSGVTSVTIPVTFSRTSMVTEQRLPTDIVVNTSYEYGGTAYTDTWSSANNGGVSLKGDRYPVLVNSADYLKDGAVVSGVAGETCMAPQRFSSYPAVKAVDSIEYDIVVDYSGVANGDMSSELKKSSNTPAFLTLSEPVIDAAAKTKTYTVTMSGMNVAYYYDSALEMQLSSSLQPGDTIRCSIPRVKYGVYHNVFREEQPNKTWTYSVLRNVEDVRCQVDSVLPANDVGVPSVLARFTVRNYEGADSGPKEVVLDFASTLDVAGISPAAISVPVPAGSTVSDFKYKLATGAEGTISIDSTRIGDDGHLDLTLSDFPGLKADSYLQEIRYKLDKIPANSSADARIYGEWLDTATSSAPIRLTVTDQGYTPAQDERSEHSWSVRAGLTYKRWNCATVRLDTTRTGAQAAAAGERISLAASVRNYGAVEQNAAFANPLLIVRDPSKNVIDRSSIKVIQTATNEDIAPLCDITGPYSDTSGAQYYVIDTSNVPRAQAIAGKPKYANEEFSGDNMGLLVSWDVVTAPNSLSGTYLANEAFFVASGCEVKNGDINLGSQLADDLYGVVPNAGGYYDKVLTNRNAFYEIIARSDLVVTNDSKYSSEDESAYASYEAHGAMLVAEQESVDKRVRVINNSGATVTQGIVYRVIPKKGEYWGNLIHAETTDENGNAGANRFPFSMELVGPASVSAHDAHIAANSFAIHYAVVDVSSATSQGDIDTALANAAWEDWDSAKAAQYNCIRVDGSNIQYLSDPGWDDATTQDHNTVDVVATTKLTVDSANPDSPKDDLLAVWSPYYFEDVTNADGREYKAWQQGESMAVQTCRGVMAGTVWVDSNRNGEMDASEAGRLSGWTMNLYGASDLETPLQTTVTDRNGEYRFNYVTRGLDGGERYLIEAVSPDSARYRFSPAGATDTGMRLGSIVKDASNGLQTAARSGDAADAVPGIWSKVKTASGMKAQSNLAAQATGADGLYNVGAYRIYPVTYAASTGGTVTYQQENGAYVGTSSAPEYVEEGDAPAKVATPQPSSGYVFDGWVADVPLTVNGASKAAGTLLSAQDMQGVSVERDVNFTARFKRVYTVSYAFAGQVPAGVTVPASAQYAQGDTVTVAAAPADTGGYAFGGWTGAAGSTQITPATTTFTMPAANVVITGTWTGPVAADLKVAKHLAGRAWTDADSFTFTLTPVEGAPMRTTAGGASVSSVTTTATKTAHDPTPSFPALYFQKGDLGGNKSAVFAYNVAETSTMPGGVTKAQDRQMKVRVVDEGDGSLAVEYLGYDEATGELLDENATASWLQTVDAPDMTNTYAVSGSVSTTLSAKKAIRDTAGNEDDDWKVNDTSEGEHDWSSQQFAFVLLSSDDSTPMPANANARTDGHAGRFARSTTDASIASGKLATFDAISYTQPGTYYYDIREVRAEAAGDASSEGYVDGLYIHDHLVYSTTAHSVRVTVTDNGNGTLSAPVVAYGADGTDEPSTFNNLEQGDAEIVLGGWKQLEGHELEGGMFQFELYKMPDATSPVSDGERIDTGTVTATGLVEKAVEFNMADLAGADSKVFHFAGVEKNTGNPAVTYSDAVHRYAVTVAKKVDSPTEIQVTKVEIDPGTGTFNEIALQEDPDTGQSVVPSTSFPVHYNTYKAEGSAQLDASKHVAGRDSWNTGESYSFVLTGEEGAPLKVKDSSGQVVPVADGKLTATATADHRIVDFDDLWFTQDDMQGAEFVDGAWVREFTYRIHEVCDVDGDGQDDNPVGGGASKDGVTYAADHVVTVRVADDSRGTLSVTYAGRDGYTNTPANPQFVNVYEPTGEVSADIVGAKTLVGRSWSPDDAFELVLTAGDNTRIDVETPLPEGAQDGKASAFARSNSADATWEGAAANTKSVPFGSVTFTRAGTYRYTISEVVPGASAEANGIAYDTSEIEVTVVVGDNSMGGLTEPVITYGSSDNPVALVNEYSAAPAEVSLGVEKVLTGYMADQAWPGDSSFSFTLAPVAAAPVPQGSTSALVDASSAIVSDNSVPNGHHRAASFGNVTFDRAGTFRYAVTEDAGSVGGFEYDDAAQLITVTVTDDGKGSLVAEVSDTPVFVNAYSPSSEPGKANVKVEKSSSKVQVVSGDEVTYTLKATNSGDASAYGLYVKDYVPKGMTYLSSGGDGAPVYGATLDGDEYVTWWIDELAAGGTATMTVTVRVDACRPGDSFKNTAAWELVEPKDPSNPDSKPERPSPTYDPDPAKSGGQTNTVAIEVPADSEQKTRPTAAASKLPSTGDPLAPIAALVGIAGLMALACAALGARRREE